MRRLLRRPSTITVLLTAVLALAVPAGAASAWGPPRAPASTPVTCAGPAVHKANGQAWTCTFDDEFNSAALNSAKWLPITTASNGVTAGTGGCAVNSSRNIWVSGGQLRLTARKESRPFTCHSPKGDFITPYSAGQVASWGKFSQTYGRFAVRAAFPPATAAGLQSALWLWPQNLSSTGLAGEIDIAEQYSQFPDRVIPYLHYNYDQTTVNPSSNTNIVTNNYCMIGDVTALHEYVLEWTKTSMSIKYDGQTCLVDNYAPLGVSPFDQPFFVALSQSFGVSTNAVTAATPLPATARVDWVRVWK